MHLARNSADAAGVDTIEPEEIRAELDRILAGADFRGSPRRRDLLSYLIEETLAGRADRLKGYSIAVSVFGRGEDFDQRTDPVVRLEARRLRLDLASYYVSEGRANPLRIAIPKGHYAPEFFRQESETPPHSGGSHAAIAAQPGEATDEREGVEPDRSAGSSATARRRVSRFSMIAVLAGILLLSALAYWLPKSAERTDEPRTVAEGPAVMVQPFEARSEIARVGFLATGITDQVITDLSRFAGLRIYLPSPDRGRADGDALVVGDRVGVSYVVSGSVFADSDIVRIAARLVEVPTGQVLWANEYERALSPSSLLAMQGEIADAIATALGQPYGVIRTDLTSRLSGGVTPSLPSYECVLRSYAYRRNFDPALHEPLMGCLLAAVKRDPDYADAWAMLGWLYLDAGRFNMVPADQAGGYYKDALDAASHAAVLDSKNILALQAMASINHYLGNFSESRRLQREALALNPNDPDTLAQLGWRLAVRGDFSEGVPYLERAIERTVNPPGWYFHLISIDHYLKGQYAEMLETAKRGAMDNSGIAWSLVAIANGALGNQAAAKEALGRMAAAAPGFLSDPAAVYRVHRATDQIVDALVDGLRKAGWTAPSGT